MVVREVQPGTWGNDRRGEDDLAAVGLWLEHTSADEDVAIGMHEVQGIRCHAPTGLEDSSFSLRLFGDEIAVNASDSLAELQHRLAEGFTALRAAAAADASGNLSSVVTVSAVNSSQTTVCAESSPAEVRIGFVSIPGSLPALQAVVAPRSAEEGLAVDVREAVKGVDSVRCSRCPLQRSPRGPSSRLAWPDFACPNAQGAWAWLV